MDKEKEIEELQKSYVIFVLTHRTAYRVQMDWKRYVSLRTVSLQISLPI